MSTVGKDIYKGEVKQDDGGPCVVESTQLGNFKRYDEGLSVVGSTQRDMIYAEVVSKR